MKTETGLSLVILAIALGLIAWEAKFYLAIPWCFALGGFAAAATLLHRPRGGAVWRYYDEEEGRNRYDPLYHPFEPPAEGRGGPGPSPSRGYYYFRDEVNYR